MNLKQSIKKAAMIGATALALALPGKLEAQTSQFEPVVVGSKMALREDQPAMTQSYLSFGKHKFVTETSETLNKYGLNLEDTNYRVNLGLADLANSDKDSSRLVALAKWSGNNAGFAGVDYQHTPTCDKYGPIASVKVNDKLSLTGTFLHDTNGNNAWRAASFLDTSFLGKPSKLGIGAGENFDGTRELQLTASARLNKDYGANAHLRLGDNNLLDARLRIGRPTQADQCTKSFAVTDNGYNDLGSIGTVSSPLALGPFAYTSADGQCGTNTFDLGFDARYLEAGKSRSGFVNLAVNLGDYGLLNDVTLSPEYHRNFVTGLDGFRIGASTKLFNKAKVWYQGTFNQDSKPDHAVFVGFDLPLGGGK